MRGKKPQGLKIETHHPIGPSSNANVSLPCSSALAAPNATSAAVGQIVSEKDAGQSRAMSDTGERLGALTQKVFGCRMGRQKVAPLIEL